MDTEVNVKTKGGSDKTVVSPDSVKVRHLRSSERFPWQRLTLSLLGISILVGVWRWATFHLYTMPDHAITAFSSITNNTVYAIAALVIFFVTGRLIYEWKNQTITQIAEKTSHLFEKREEKIDKNITVTEKVDENIVSKFSEQYKDDPSYRPIDTVPDMDAEIFR